ncbi:MAG: Wzz/FepE/Etk N-terminal domain-containing protein [Bacteroidota bacterium]
MQTSSFNLVQTTAVLQKRWRTILLFVVIAAVAATVTVFVMPRYYRSTSTVVPANPALADKARLFNNNIQSLYSYFGTGDDLDRIYGIADMRSTYVKLVDEFSLVNYYQLKDDSLTILKSKAAKCLQKDIHLEKTEQNQLQVIAWTKDKQLSANLVNRMVAIIQETEMDIWKTNYQNAQDKLNNSIALKEKEYQLLSDSLSTLRSGKQQLAIAQMQTIAEQISQYRKTAGEFTIASQTPPVALYVMEAAMPSASAERPDKLMIILGSCLVAFVFSSLLVLVNDRKSMA